MARGQIEAGEAAAPHAFCLERGLLVAGDDWLPDDARDYHAGGVGLFVGCNQLVCDGCRRAVRGQLGFASAPALSAAALSELADWTTLPEFRAGTSGRLYACGCTVRLVFAMTALEVPEYALEYSDAPPWRCAGHPPLVRPTTFAGLSLAAAPDWSALAAEALARRGDPALHARVDGLVGFGAHRLYLALADASSRDAFSDAVAAEAIAKPNLLVAGVLFFALHPMATGFDALVVHATRNLAGLRGVPAGWGPEPTLERYLFNAMTVHLTMTPSGGTADTIRAALRDAASVAPGLGPWLDWFARIDRDWAVDHLATLLAASPESWRRLWATVKPDRPGPVLDAASALVATGQATRDAVLATLAEVSSREFAGEIERRWVAGPN